MEEKAISLATGGLTYCLRTQFAGTFHGRVGSANGLCAGVCWPRNRGQCVNYQLKHWKKWRKRPPLWPQEDLPVARGLNSLVPTTGELAVPTVCVLVVCGQRNRGQCVSYQLKSWKHVRKRPHLLPQEDLPVSWGLNVLVLLMGKLAVPTVVCRWSVGQDFRSSLWGNKLFN